MVVYTLKTTPQEVEDIMKCYDMLSINSVVTKLLQEQYGETEGSIVSVSIDLDPVTQSELVITVLKQ